jgi:cyanophycinase-like exopeptidase
MKTTCIVTFLFLNSLVGFTQHFTNYFTGNPVDVTIQPSGGICLMGGASENDNAIAWFLNRANGGDVLVLRASGSDGYNNYLYSGLGVAVNSVETIVCHNLQASFDPYVQQKIQHAEAIWFAGGDQWDYISFWRNTPVDSLINEAISQRNIAVGGTSAGMAIQGRFYFSAENGTVGSSTATSNPYASNVTVDSTRFIENALLSEVVTDTHFDNPDRKGRLTAFLARIWMDYQTEGKAIACDEYTAVCIDPNGMASVYGDYPTYEDYAYFVQTNCALTNPLPENCSAGSALTWNHNGQALKAYKIGGTPNGSGTFSLVDWVTGTGGEWMDWSIVNGQFQELNGDGLDCTGAVATQKDGDFYVHVFPNPVDGKIHLQANESQVITHISIVDARGARLRLNPISSNLTEWDVSTLENGIYWVFATLHSGQTVQCKFVKGAK